MEKYVMKKRFGHPVLSGLATVAFLLVFASIAWITWSLVWKQIFLFIGGNAVSSLSSGVQGHFLKEAVEGTFFWMVIGTWVWFSLNMGNYGKYTKSMKQPIVGIRYTLLAFLAGLLGFVAFVSLMGLWWEPFNWQILFRPGSEQEGLLAIKGWAATNFFALTVILAQIPLVSLFGKYPFSKLSHEPRVIAIGTLSLGLFLAMLSWVVFILPSFMTFEIDGTAVTGTPFGDWSTALAWCQLFIFFFLLPAEGAEGYPQKFITTKQPWSGFVGLGIALVGAFTFLPLLRILLTPLANSLGLAPDMAVASVTLTIINVLLTWHHHFDDYPSKEVMPSTVGRIMIQLVIVLIIGSVLGILWLTTTLELSPFGANDLSLGHPMLGILGGQFVYMMPMLFMNTFFDKWPLAKSVKE